MLTVLLLLACFPDPGSSAKVQTIAYLNGDLSAPPIFGFGKALPADVLPVLVDALTRKEDAAKAIRLLIDLQARADPLAVHGANVLRDDAVIAVLIGEACKSEQTQEPALRALLRNVPRELLRVHRASLEGLTPTNLLALRVLAKAGRGGDASGLGRIEGLVLRAAGGDSAAEDLLIARFHEAASGTARAEALAHLGWAATDRSLATLAVDLRSPLLRTIGEYKRSIRLDVLEALLPHWPGEPSFFPNHLASGKDLIRAEVEVSKRLNITFVGDRPPFFTQGRSAPDGLWERVQ